MFFRQVLHGDLGCASYLIADTGAGDGAVVDPKWAIDEYLELAGRHGFRIGHVVETHNHADHVSGRSRLVEATGAASGCTGWRGATYEHTPFEDGDEIARRRGAAAGAAHPGPSAGALRHRGDRPAARHDPVAVLTGDSLFVNDVARPDLAVEKREGAASCSPACSASSRWATPSRCYPGPHRRLAVRQRADGREDVLDRRLRARPQPAAADHRAEPVRRGDGRPPCAPQPPNFKQIAETNRHDGADPRPAAGRADGRAVRPAAPAGALMIDGRTPEDYAAGHAPGSVGVTLGRAASAPRPPGWPPRTASCC